MTRFYLAAPWTKRTVAANLAQRIEDDFGWCVAHPWWDYEAEDTEHSKLRDCATLDMLAVMGCDKFVLLNTEKSEGKAVETGLALAARTFRGNSRPELIGIGPRYTNIFHHLDRWLWFGSTQQFLAFKGFGTAEGTTRCCRASVKTPA